MEKIKINSKEEFDKFLHKKLIEEDMCNRSIKYPNHFPVILIYFEVTDDDSKDDLWYEFVYKNDF